MKKFGQEFIAHKEVFNPFSCTVMKAHMPRTFKTQDAWTLLLEPGSSPDRHVGGGASSQ